MGRPVVHFEVNGRDMHALGQFFQQLFDWDLQPMPGMNYTIVTPGDGPTGGIGQVETDDQRWVTFYVSVDDPDAYLKKAEQLGGSIVMPTSAVPGGPTIGIFATPEGHRIGVVKT
jgi:predicted enzyme related to lactoylglutathione lyase